MDVMSAVDFPVIDRVNAIGGVFIMIATYFFGEHWMLFIAFLVLNVLDYITGLMKSHVLKNESSSAGLLGVVKKFSYWIMITISFGISPILNHIGEMMGGDISLYTPFIGWFVLASLSLNELRSILENLYESGVSVPPILVKSLKVAEKLLATQEAKLDGALEIKDSEDDPYHVELLTSKSELEEKDTVTLKIKTVNREDE